MVQQQRESRLLELEAQVRALRQELGEVTPPLLSKREALLVEAERVAHMGSWAWNLKTGEIDWSDEFCRILGFDRQHVVPTSEAFFGAVHEEDRARVQEVAQRGLSTGDMRPVDFRVVRPGGEVRQVRMEAALVHDAQGEHAHVVGTVLDVTEQVHSARLLAHTIDSLTDAERMAGLGSWRWNPALGEIEWSTGMRLLLGVPPDGPPSEETFLSRVHLEDRQKVFDACARAAASRVPASVELRIVREDGSVRDVSMCARAAFDAEGEPAGWCGVMQDLTESKSLAAQLRHSQMMEAVGTLAGGIAHDFNNYLMVVAVHTDVLAACVESRSSGRDSVDAIAEACQRCANLTKQLLTISRKRKSEPRDLDLPELLRGLASMLRAALGETFCLRFDFASHVSRVHADPSLVEQVVMNLVVNARDAMPNGGTITLRVQEADPPDPLRSVGTRGPDERYVELAVRDQGCGMDEGLRSRIFEPFFTTKQVGKGTGLGLSTVYGILSEAGGSVDVESEPGRGSTFCTYWPASEAEEAPRESQLVPVMRKGHGQTILLVEDVAQVRQLLRSQLERAGYVVESAADGAEALAVAGRVHVEAVISDAVMPQMGGIELVAHLRALQIHIPCILMTGYSDQALIGLGEVQPVEVLHKPFAPSDLLRTLGRALHRRDRSSHALIG